MSNNYYNFPTPFVAGTKVRAAAANTQFSGLETAFDSLPTTPASLVTGTAWFGTETQGATVNDFLVASPDPQTALVDGQHVEFFAVHTNTGASTLDVDGIGPLSLVKVNGAALIAGDITSGQFYTCIYDDSNTKFVLGLGVGANANTITVADESSAGTYYPLFVTAATGELAAKTGSNITFNASTGAFAVGGGISSLGFADTATATMAQLQDDVLILGQANTLMTIRHSDDSEAINIHGGDNSATAGQIALFGSSGASAGDWALKSNQANTIDWDESAGELSFFTGAGGSKNLALTIAATNGTFVGSCTAASFSGAGTNLTGTAASLTAGNATLAAGLSAALAVASGGTGVTSKTGTGNVVLSNAPTLVGPILGTPASGNLANCTFPTLNQNTTGTAATVTAAAQPTITSVGTLTGFTTDGQIKFPATQSPSADVNTLDDYQEGTFNPEVWDGSNADEASYTTQTGQYVKIGRLVHYQIDLLLSSLGTLSGAIKIAFDDIGLTIAGDASVAGVSVWAENLAITSGLSVTGNMSNLSTHPQIELYLWNATTGATDAMTAAELTASGHLVISGTFFADG